jgi:uncharacterized protein (TIGR02231 family)
VEKSHVNHPDSKTPMTMKYSFALLLALFYAVGLHAQQEKEVDSHITQVTVFLNKAQVSREIKTTLSAGKVSLVVAGLTSMLDPESIQATGKGSFIILGIAPRQNFITELNIPKPLKLLRDSIDFYQRQLALEQSQKEILNKEEQMLLSNQKIGGTNQNVTVAELKAMADFYRNRLSEIVTARMKEDEKIKKLNTRIAKLQRQLNEQNELYTRNTTEIVINVSAEAATNAELSLSYVVNGAGWSPQYDLRATNTKSPVQLSYKANVYQATGEEWKNIKLKLSTANPSQGGLKPELPTWNLDFYQPISYEYNRKDSRAAGPAPMMRRSAEEPTEKLEADVEEVSAQSLSDFVTTVQTTLNVEFDISLPYTIFSAGKPTLVDIRNHELKAVYEYAVAPKLDPDAFLLAKGTGWEDFNLLPGEANIFFEGTFVSKTFIDPNNIKDTLAISLGRDKRIVVKREKQKDMTSRKVIGTSQRESYTWEISIRNTKSEPVKITVEDQLPVSQNTQIEVLPIDLGSAKFNAVNGKLSWNLNLQPNETKKLVYKFDVKYPKDRQVSGL